MTFKARATAHTGTPGTNTDAGINLNQQALDLQNTATGLGAALRILSDQGLGSDILPDRALSVYFRQYPMQILPDLSPSDLKQLDEQCYFLNHMLGRTVEIYPLKNGCLIADIDTFGANPALCPRLIEDQQYFSNTAIMADLVFRNYTAPQSLNFEPQFDQNTFQSLVDTLTEMKDKKSGHQTFLTPIEHLATPSARDANELRACLQSCIDSLRVFGHRMPTFWVFDDATPEEQELKKAVCQELEATEQVTIKHIDSAQKQTFENEIFKDLASTHDPNQISELRTLAFKKGAFGTPRNFVHLYLSGSIYSTLDDDARLTCTIRRNWPVEVPRTSQEQFETELFMTIKGRFDKDSPGPLMVDSSKITTIRPSEALDRFLRHLNNPLDFSQRFYSALKDYLDRIEIHPTTEKYPTRNSYSLNSCHVFDNPTDIELVTLPCDIFGVHSSNIGRQISETSSTTCHTLDGLDLHPYLTPENDDAFVCMIGTMPNYHGAGSTMNNLRSLLDTGDPKSLVTGSSDVFQTIPRRTVSAAHNELCTTTLTTIDNRTPTGLILSGEMDSHPFGHAVQAGNPKRSFLQPAIGIDHFRKPSTIREQSLPSDPTQIAPAIVKRLLSEHMLLFASNISEYAPDNNEEPFAELVQQALLTINNLVNYFGPMEKAIIREIESQLNAQGLMRKTGEIILQDPDSLDWRQINMRILEDLELLSQARAKFTKLRQQFVTLQAQAPRVHLAATRVMKALAAKFSSQVST